MLKRLAVFLVAVVCLSGCSGSPAAPAPVVGGDPDPRPPLNAFPTAFLAGAGDIADCGPGAALTAALLDRVEGTVFTTGDNAYPNGTAAEFRNCYDPTWGRHRARTRPTPGNHDYSTANAAPYYEYFGDSAGPAGLGYYSYPLGAWHVVALNSEIDARTGSAQEQWLRADLARNRNRCTAVYFHRAIFSSGRHGGDARMMDIWRTLYELDADLVITGHEHMYERFAPQDDGGRVDSTRGIRQFVVGTGGATIHQGRNVARNSDTILSAWGVLALTLDADSYRWRFITIDGSIADEGSATCH
jgi:3',5'-cyclic AMP phosphodiesterase CpdA